MSRALTVWNRRDAGSQYDNSEVERIMAQQGCSEPVAKNLIKYAKLGVGPLANAGQRDPDDDRHGDRGGGASGSSREQFPPRLDRKAAAALAEAKLRERQEQEEEDEARLKASQPKKKFIGIARLGAVMARADEVDPYKQPSRPAKKREEDDAEAEDQQGLAIFEARPQQRNGMGGMFKKPMQIGGITSIGATMARVEAAPVERQGPPASEGEEDDDMEEEAVQGDDNRTRQFTDKKRAPDGNQWKAGGKKNKKQRRDRDASQSQESEDEARRDANRPSGHEREGGNREDSQASGSLMSEKQVMAMMGKQRKVQGEGTKRGSVRAQSRIQKEREEWERAKANNPEFWKAPQFALCYSAETGKKARGAG